MISKDWVSVRDVAAVCVAGLTGYISQPAAAAILPRLSQGADVDCDETTRIFQQRPETANSFIERNRRTFQKPHPKAV